MAERSRFVVGAAAALLFTLSASRAAPDPNRWGDGPGKTVTVAEITGSAAQGDSIRAVADGTVFIGWLGGSYDAVAVQKLGKNGAPLWGQNGIKLRRNRPCFAVGDARIHSGGPLDMIPDSAGGAWVGWTENSGARDFRLQHVDARANQLLGDGGLLLFTGVPRVAAGGPVESSSAAILGDGKGGIHAAAVTSETSENELRYLHVPARMRDGAADADLLIDGSPGEKRYPCLTTLPGGAVAITWWSGNSLWLQIVEKGDTRLDDGGVVVLDGVAEAPFALRATGTSKRPLLLLSALLPDGEARLLLLEKEGDVLWDEMSIAAGAGLADAPEVATVGGLVHGFPEGIDLHGILPGDPRGCVRSVRLPGGTWDVPEAITPPLPVAAGQTGAVGGPLWFWALDSKNYGRLVAYRETTVGRDLVPRLGPWMAFCPGSDDGSRLSVMGSWVYHTWVDPTGQAIYAARNLLKRSGKEANLGPVLREALFKSGTLTVRMDGVRPPRPKAPGDLRLVVAGENGLQTPLDLVSVTNGAAGSWTATVANGTGTAQATVKVGLFGDSLTIDATGIPVPYDSRAFYLRLVTRSKVWKGTVVLRPLSTGGGEFVPGEE